ncbi:MAG: ATP-binding protein [Candidatus Aquicultor sp.]
MIDKRLKLLLLSEPQSLDPIRKEVQDFISGTSYQSRASDILLVVSEACTNVIRHAYDASYENPLIMLECFLKLDALTIMVSDKGKGLPAQSGGPVFSEDGGFGVFLMQKLSDRFKCYSLPGSGTVLELGFKNPEYHLMPKRRKASMVVDTATAYWLTFADMLSHPRKSYSAYRECLGAGFGAMFDSLRPCWKSIAILFFIRSAINDVRKALKRGDHETARLIIEEIGNQIKVVELDLRGMSGEGRSLLKKHLEGAFSKLSKLKRELGFGEEKEMPDSSGIYASVAGDDIIELVDGIIENLNNMLDDSIGCWIALDEGPLQPI